MDINDVAVQEETALQRPQTPRDLAMLKLAPNLKQTYRIWKLT